MGSYRTTLTDGLPYIALQAVAIIFNLFNAMYGLYKYPDSIRVYIRIHSVAKVCYVALFAKSSYHFSCQFT